MNVVRRAILISSLLFFISACDAPKATEGDTPAATPAATTIELTAEGQKFDPPIKSAEVPNGAWYCDMGTVHYARSEKGDGTCPICKMHLKEKAAPKK